MAMAGGWLDKLKDFAKGNPQQADTAIEKVEDLIDKQTGGKYADRVDKGGDALRDQLGLPDTIPEPVPAPEPEPVPAPEPEPVPAPEPSAGDGPSPDQPSDSEPESGPAQIPSDEPGSSTIPGPGPDTGEAPDKELPPFGRS
jgi:hypothetical protein